MCTLAASCLDETVVARAAVAGAAWARAGGAAQGVANAKMLASTTSFWHEHRVRVARATLLSPARADLQPERPGAAPPARAHTQHLQPPRPRQPSHQGNSPQRSCLRRPPGEPRSPPQASPTGGHCRFAPVRPESQWPHGRTAAMAAGPSAGAGEFIRHSCIACTSLQQSAWPGGLSRARRLQVLRGRGRVVLRRALRMPKCWRAEQHFGMSTE